MATQNANYSTGAQRLLGVGAMVLMVALATVSAYPIYQTWRLVLAAAVGLAIGVGGVVLGARFAAAWYTVAAVIGAAFAVAIVPVAVPSAMVGVGRAIRGGVDGLAAIVVGWKQLLTLSVPVGDYHTVLVPFFFVITVAATVGAALVWHGGRWAPLAAIPAAASVVFGAAFGLATTGPSMQWGPVTLPAPMHVLVSLGAFAILVAWLLARGRLARQQSLARARAASGLIRQRAESFLYSSRRHVVSALMVAAALAALVFVTPMAAGLGDRQVWREEVAPVVIFEDQPSPLSTYRSWYDADSYAAELFRVTGDAGVDRLRIATLEAYDGETFHVSARADGASFTRQPGRQDAMLEVTILDGYAGVWLPLATADGGAPAFTGARAEELADAYYASSTLGAAVVVAESSDGELGLAAGDTYAIAAPASDADGARAAFERAVGGAPLLVVEDYPQMEQWLEMQDLGRSGADYLELVERLRARGYLSHAVSESTDTAAWVRDLTATSDYVFQASRSGHSVARVDALFGAMTQQELRVGTQAPPEELVAAVGDAEQFSVASALIARALGFESRVVLGVRLDDGDGVVEPCATVCTGANVTAWAEVRSASGVWIPVDVNPQYELVPNRVRAGEDPPEIPTEVRQVNGDVLEPPTVRSDATSDASTDDPEGVRGTSMIWTVIVWVLKALAASILLLLPALVLPIARGLRRLWRRNARVPEVAIVGAWEELVDTYVDLGMDVPRLLTRAETADVVERPRAAAIATIADRAVFAEHPPTRDASSGAWSIFDEERQDLRAQATWRRRALAMLTVPSIWREFRSGRRFRPQLHTDGKASHGID